MLTVAYAAFTFLIVCILRRSSLLNLSSSCQFRKLDTDQGGKGVRRITSIITWKTKLENMV